MLTSDAVLEYPLINSISKLVYALLISRHPRYESVHTACRLVFSAISNELGNRRVEWFCRDIDNKINYIDNEYFVFIKTKSDLRKAKSLLGSREYDQLELLDIKHQIIQQSLDLPEKRLMLHTLAQRMSTNNYSSYQDQIHQLVALMLKHQFLDDCFEDAISILPIYKNISGILAHSNNNVVEPIHNILPKNLQNNSSMRQMHISNIVDTQYHNNFSEMGMFGMLNIEDWPTAACLAYKKYKNKRPPYMGSLAKIVQHIQVHGSPEDACAFELIHDLLYAESNVLNMSSRSYHRDDFSSWRLMSTLTDSVGLVEYILNDLQHKSFRLDNGLYVGNTSIQSMELDTNI